MMLMPGSCVSFGIVGGSVSASGDHSGMPGDVISTHVVQGRDRCQEVYRKDRWDRFAVARLCLE
jgi:hypothetical protein